MVAWAFFGIAFGVGMKTDLFQSCGHCWVSQMCWHIVCSTFTASSFKTWNSSAGIPSPPLALFIVMLPKAQLTSHSRISDSRWVITWSCLSGSWRSYLYSSSVYSCHLFLISSASVRSIPFLSFIALLHEMFSLISLMFLKRSFSGSSLPKYFQGWSLRVELLIRLNLTAGYDPPRSPEEWEYTYPIFPFCLTPAVKPSLLPGRNLSTPLDNLGTWMRPLQVLQDHVKQTQKAVFKWAKQMLPAAVSLGLSKEGAGKNVHLPVSLEGIWLHASPAAAWGSGFWLLQVLIGILWGIWESWWAHPLLCPHSFLQW